MNLILSNQSKEIQFQTEQELREFALDTRDQLFTELKHFIKLSHMLLLFTMLTL